MRSSSFAPSGLVKNRDKRYYFGYRLILAIATSKDGDWRSNISGRKIVFCDFDGTITAEETLVAMLHQFVPDQMKAFSRKFAEKKITLRQGVRQVVESIPSAAYPDVVNFIRSRPIRPGFEAFLHFLADRGISFVVISGGLMDSVATRLEPYMHLIHSIHAAEIDASGSHLKVASRFEADDELVAKVRVMALYAYEECAAVGDGATDRKMALNATVVFARDRLARFMKKNGRQYVPWNDFFDIKNHLSKLTKEATWKTNR